MITGKTSKGFKYEINERKLHDYRILPFIEKLTSEDSTPDEKAEAALTFVPMMLGRDQEEALVSYLESKSEDGIATLEEVYEQANEIMDRVNAGGNTLKNSQSSPDISTETKKH